MAPLKPASGASQSVSQAIPLYTNGMRVGLLGGSFNPAHEGHRHVAELAMRRWLVERPREPARPPYSATDFGLNEAQIDQRFATYNSRFRSGAEPFRRI